MTGPESVAERTLRVPPYAPHPLPLRALPLVEPSAMVWVSRSLAELRRELEAALTPRCVPVGGLFDVVITAGGVGGRRAVEELDRAHPRGCGDHPQVCGPVVAQAGRPWLYWLVPPGTARSWTHAYGRCLGPPETVWLPPSLHRRPEHGLYWVRPPVRPDLLVGPGMLRRALDLHQSSPPPALPVPALYAAA
ncbi:hypothetical protein ABT354_36415 [Streptomyces sp. NPDC000594]|uniref:hypothetical protein n=1 Tax=Streptomyces sp. NPDC000594 TaxID=3154261 RepID=UPI00333328B5